MKISNFEMVSYDPRDFSSSRFAEVDVEVGFWFWKRKGRMQVCRTAIGSWFFVQTGQFCLGFEVEQLERAWEARQKLRAMGK